LNLDDPWSDPGTGTERSGLLFQPDLPAGTGAFLDGADPVGREREAETYSLERCPAGLHNRENALAAALGARLAGASSPGIKGAWTISRLRHRLEFVAEINGSVSTMTQEPTSRPWSRPWKVLRLGNPHRRRKGQEAITAP
jgi:hypothetical protein